MEPDVIRLYSSSPPPLEDGGAEEEDDEFSDFTGVPNSVSFTEFETPTSFDQLQALNATSPPEFIGNGRIVGLQGPALSNGAQQEVPACKTGVFTNFSGISGHSRTGAVDCNGGNKALTNGFDTERTPPSFHKRREPDAIPKDDSFADFAAFSNADAPTYWESSNHEEGLARDDRPRSEGHQRADKDTTGFASVIEASGCLSNGDWGFHEGTFIQRDQETDDAHPNSNPAESLSTDEALAQNGVELDGLEVEDKVESRVSLVSAEDKGSNGEPTEDKGSGNDTETETETETSFGRPLSTEALEEFGDFSTTGSVPSPPLQEETVTPADHSQLAEDDEDFGDFGDTGSFGGFADFEQQGTGPETTCPDEDEFGDFDSHAQTSEPEQGDNQGMKFGNVPGSDSFADFTSAPPDDDWQAFSETESTGEAAGSWAAFGQDRASANCEKTDEGWHEGTAPSAGISDDCERDGVTVSLISRLEKLFLATFPDVCAPPLEDDVPPLGSVLDPHSRSDQEREAQAPSNRSLQAVWQRLQDIHNALGLRHQWGGSYSNKALLSSLGIDTRNILFTGQKKQPVIVPMYAASLGMLEPTKEPVKPVSAAEMIASIAQSPSVSTEMSSCPGDAAQDSLPPVQFDWSSSGLTNPLDASGGSSLLNLDFFGPVDESPSSLAGSIPGVDPELYELTQAKLEVTGGSSKVADAFARLMSTVEKTNTSTRRVQVQKEENLSEEARRVICTLPDLSFMQAKVLMFPSTLTPLPLSASSSPSPVPD